LPRLKPGPISEARARTRPGAEARFFEGMGLPRLKPGPISEARARTRPGAEARFVEGMVSGA